MENLIPCRFHTEVESVLKAEGLRATAQRLNIWDEILILFFFVLKRRKSMFQEQLYIEQLMCLLIMAY